MNEQIEEMANVIARLIPLASKARCTTVAITLYEQNYRKQSEGCDFCKEGDEKCGTCVKFFDYYEDGGSDRCSCECGREKCFYYKPVPHCSNCGAKLKGSE
jgi:hypothetical protein